MSSTAWTDAVAQESDDIFGLGTIQDCDLLQQLDLRVPAADHLDCRVFLMHRAWQGNTFEQTECVIFMLDTCEIELCSFSCTVATTGQEEKEKPSGHLGHQADCK